MANFYFLSAFLHISNLLQWICIMAIICKRLVLKFIWNYNFMVVILQSKLFCLHVEVSFSLFLLCAFSHVYFYLPAFNALTGQLSSPVRHSGCVGLSGTCAEKTIPTSQDMQVLLPDPTHTLFLRLFMLFPQAGPPSPLTSANLILHVLPFSVKNSAPVETVHNLVHPFIHKIILGHCPHPRHCCAQVGTHRHKLAIEQRQQQKSSMTGVLIKSGNLERWTQWNTMWRWRQKSEWCFSKPRNAWGCQQTTRSQVRGMEHNSMPLEGIN